MFVSGAGDIPWRRSVCGDGEEEATNMRLTVAKHIAVGLGWPLNEVRLDGDGALRDARELAHEIMKFRQCRWAEDYWTCAAMPFLTLGILYICRLAEDQRRLPSLSDLEVVLHGRPTEVGEKLAELTRRLGLTDAVTGLFEESSALPGILATAVDAVNMYRQAIERGQILPERESTRRRKRKRIDSRDGQLRRSSRSRVRE
jgi:hypothetical protein